MKQLLQNLRPYLCLFFLTSFLLLSTQNSYASHALGADITYSCIGPNEYQVNLTAYRDCNGIYLGNTTTINWSGDINGTPTNGSFTVVRSSVTDITPLFLGASACNGGNGFFGVEAHAYSANVLLPAGIQDIVFSYRTCCRNNAVTTLINPGGESIYVPATASSAAMCNNSPVFFNPPLIISCVGQTRTYNLGGFDPDGDSLAFSLVPCLDNVNVPVNYNAGITPTNFLGGGTPISIDSSTGVISFTPTTFQVGVLCVMIQEFRNGVLIGSVTRDIQSHIYNCPGVSDAVITGTVYEDANNNCQQDSTEQGLGGRYLRLMPGGFLTLSKPNGDYSFLGAAIDTYTVELLMDTTLWGYTCPNPGIRTVPISSFSDTVSNLDFGAEIIAYCADLSVDVSIPRLRPCTAGAIYVQYCNDAESTTSVDSVYITVDLDSALVPYAASLPWTSVNGSEYTFNIGTLNPNTCGTFTIYCNVGCSVPMGVTLCAEATIYPFDTCSYRYQDSAIVVIPSHCNLPWDKSSLNVEGSCLGDSLVCFTITNTGEAGNGDMQCFSPVRVYIDTALYLVDSVQLNGGDSLVFCFLANGHTWRLEADQHPLHPGSSHPNAVVEFCGDSSQIAQNWTPGLVNQYPMNDANPNMDTDCEITVASFDPNDKRGFPTGVSNTHLLAANTDIEYMIRFQNTGTDTAYIVVIEDELPAELDVFSVVSGASSHNYTFNIKDSRTLVWTFDNIMLPDSNANQLESNGFVSFKVKQMPNLPNGTYIRNDAAIFFDHNAPVITNETDHLIGENNFVWLITKVETAEQKANWEMNIYPNPANKQINIESEVKLLEVRLVSLTGQVVEVVKPNDLQTSLELNDLSEGVYLLDILSEKGRQIRRIVKLK